MLDSKPLAIKGCINVFLSGEYFHGISWDQFVSFYSYDKKFLTLKWKNAKYEIAWVHSHYHSWLFETKHCATLCGSFYSFFFFPDHCYDLSAVAAEGFPSLPFSLSMSHFPPISNNLTRCEITLKWLWRKE